MPRARTSDRPLFQRRHYEYMAAILKGQRHYAGINGDLVGLKELDHVTNAFANSLLSTNPGFNRARFVRACGIVASE